ncbi:hypothetical protein niasHS_001961 [Heterodera schachtii]|uniref:Uncharacterized protein n=2 Tax=Heterodera TaxID=34509 RepID=A0ABD2KAT4_HETSC
MKHNLYELEKKVREIDILCLPNDKKPNCKFDNGNSHFLYSLTEAIRCCEEQKAGQTSAGNSQNANWSMVKVLAQQFHADFDTLVKEIKLLVEIGESALSRMSKEEVEEICLKLEKLQNDLLENPGHYNGMPIQTANEKLGKILRESGHKWVKSAELDKEIQQILGNMIVAELIGIYEKELDKKFALINGISVNLHEIKTIAGIFQRKFLKIRELIGYINQPDGFKLIILKELEEKTKEKGKELKIVKNLVDSIIKAKAVASRLTNAKETKAFIKLIENSDDPLRKEVPRFFGKVVTPVNAKELLKTVFGLEEMEATKQAIEDAFMIPASEISVPKGKN